MKKYSDYNEIIKQAVTIALNDNRIIKPFPYLGLTKFQEFLDNYDKKGFLTKEKQSVYEDSIIYGEIDLFNKTEILALFDGNQNKLNDAIFYSKFALTFSHLRVEKLCKPSTFGLSKEDLTTSEMLEDIDLKKKSPIQTINICETQGLREEHEDTIIYNEANETIKQEEIFSFLSKKLEKISNEITESISHRSGSTGCVAYYNANDKIINIANIGDSRAFLVQRDKSNNSFKVKCLTYDHSAGDVFEQIVRKNKYKNAGIKISSKDGLIRTDDVGGLLSSRGFGDNSAASISSYPDFYSIPLGQNNNSEHFLVVCCDGVTEIEDDVQKIETYLNTNYTRKNCDLAECFTQFGLDSSSSDNISVISLNLDEQKKDIAIGVFDGHGGKKTAKYLADNFDLNIRQSNLTMAASCFMIALIAGSLTNLGAETVKSSDSINNNLAIISCIATIVGIAEVVFEGKVSDGLNKFKEAVISSRGNNNNLGKFS